MGKLQSSHYKNVSTDPLGTGRESLGIHGAQFGNRCSNRFRDKDILSFALRYSVYVLSPHISYGPTVCIVWGSVQFVRVLRYKQEGYGFDSRWCRNCSLT